jgi:ureidoglycolate lyase
MTNEITARPLTPAGFSAFGDVITLGENPKMINQGLCERHHDLAALDFGREGRAGISLFNAQARTLPYILEMVERHPDGSQAFLPMTQNPFLVIVAPDKGGVPGTPLAFLTEPGQGINLHRGIWHGVLTPLHAPGLFAVVDRIGDTPNLQEHWFETPYIIGARGQRPSAGAPL